MDEYKYENLKILHRLDKPTSGIVILAKNKEMAEYFRQRLHNDSVKKTYLCRVKGEVPWDRKTIVRAIILVDKAKGIYSDFDDGIKIGEKNSSIDYYAKICNLSENENIKLKENFKNKNIKEGKKLKNKNLGKKIFKIR